MRRIVIYCILLALAMMIPINRIDISDLEPIQAVRMYREDGYVILETDTGDKGIGETVKDAVSDMKKRSEGIIYLDTAQYLVIDENAQDDVSRIRPFLKEKVRVCLSEGLDKLSDLAKYMKAHRIGVQLKNWSDGIKLPQIPALSQDSS